MNRLRRTVRMPIVTAAAVAVAAAAAPLRLLRHHRQQQRLTINGVKTKVINLYYKWVMALFKQISNTLFNMKKRNRKGRGRERDGEREAASEIHIFISHFSIDVCAQQYSQYSHCELYAKNDYIFHEFRGRLAHSLTIGLVLFSISSILWVK